MITTIQERTGKIHYVDYMDAYMYISMCELLFTKSDRYSNILVISHLTISAAKFALDNQITNLVCPNCQTVFSQQYENNIIPIRSKTNVNILKKISNVSLHSVNKYLTKSKYGNHHMYEAYSYKWLTRIK